jgi:transcriptional regulator with XRE-family HTH domain
MPGFGEKLRAFRASRPEGSSLDLFYENLGVSGPTGSRYETEKTEPTLSFLQELAAKYGPDVSHLMPGTVPATGQPKVDGAVLEEAAAIVDRVVVQGRNVEATVRWELVSLVAGELLDLRALGREAEIEEKVRRWLAVAKAGLPA